MNSPRLYHEDQESPRRIEERLMYRPDMTRLEARGLMERLVKTYPGPRYHAFGYSLPDRPERVLWFSDGVSGAWFLTIEEVLAFVEMMTDGTIIVAPPVCAPRVLTTISMPLPPEPSAAAQIRIDRKTRLIIAIGSGATFAEAKRNIFLFDKAVCDRRWDYRDAHK